MTVEGTTCKAWEDLIPRDQGSGTHPVEGAQAVYGSAPRMRVPSFRSPPAPDHDSLRAFNRVMRPEGANSTPAELTAEQAARIRSIVDGLRDQQRPRADSVAKGPGSRRSVQAVG